MENVIDYKKTWFNFIDYDPHKGQKLLHYPPNGPYDPIENPDGARFIVACMGRRWGKSHSCAKEIEVILTQPNKIVWNVAPNYNTSEKIFRLVYEDMVIKKKFKPSMYSARDQVLKFEWAEGVSEFRGKSAEHPTGLIGEGCDLVVVDEASKIPNFKRIWEMYIRPTLSDKKGKAIFISTPDGFSNHFYELFQLGQQKHKNWYSLNSPSYDNNFAFPLGKDDPDLVEARNTLTKEVYRQEYEAKFTSLSGAVYGDFDREFNTGDYNWKHYLPVHVGIDFGFRQPAALFAQTKYIDNILHIYIIDELVHLTNINDEDFFNLIREKRYRYGYTFGDPAGYQVQSSVGMGSAHLYRKMTGMSVRTMRDKTSRSIASGINHVRSFILSADGSRRLHISNKCVGLIEDLESYRYPDDEGKSLKELPLKDGYHDHSMDALRYLIVNLEPINIRKLRRN